MVSPKADNDGVNSATRAGDDPARMVYPLFGNGDFKVGASVASTSSPTTRVKRYSNDPETERAVYESMSMADTVPPTAAVRSSAANAPLAERSRSTIAARAVMPSV